MERTPTSATDTLDILALLEEEEVATITEANLDTRDPLRQIESISLEVSGKSEIKETSRESLLTRFRRASMPKIQFVFYYLSISTIVFVILLATTNWNSYSTILSAYLNPQALTDSKNDIVSALDKSRVMVYADSTASETNEEEQTSLKKKMEESNTTLREDRFSPKRLISREAQINIDLEITPYDNRIIIPKIGKNIPLVDVKLDA